MTITQPKVAVTPEQMRTAIDEMRRDDVIVNAAMKAADIEQMTPEDRYTMLAYHALTALAQSRQAHLAELTGSAPAAQDRDLATGYAMQRVRGALGAYAIDFVAKYPDGQAVSSQVRGA
jgi:hypothetical protein